MNVLKPISSLLILCITCFSFAQVTFQAKVSKTKLGVNERLRIDFEMNKDGDNFVPPDFENFTVVGGPNTSISNSWLNGSRRYKKTYSYYLAPKRKGTFTIKQAVIEIEGEIYKTFPIKVEVTNAVDKPNSNSGSTAAASDKIHLVAEVSNTNPYLNEAITVVYKLYLSREVGISNYREKDIPRYNDFWSQNIEVKGLKAQNTTYKGEDYRCVILRKAVLYPQKTGKLKLEPLAVDMTVEMPTNKVDFFGRRFMNNVPHTATAGSRTINVKPLPTNGKPSDFNGAVGRFNFNVSTNKTSLDASESLQAVVEVSGKGNLKLFELPTLNTPSSLEVYEPEHKENVQTNLNGMQGKISDTYTMVPQYKGKYPLPSVSFSYFDLDTESYKTINSNDIVINVLNGPLATNTNTANTAQNNKQLVVANNNTFAFIKTKSNWVSKSKTPFFKSGTFWTLLITPFFLIPFTLIMKKQKEIREADIVGTRTRKADKLAKKYLSEAKKTLNNKEAFYIALEKALHNYLKAKLRIETSDFNKEKIKDLLTQKGIEHAVSNNFIAILENCDLARYTPIDQNTMDSDYDKAAKTIGLIDKQLR